WWLVGVVDTGQPPQLAGESASVEPLRVALGADGDRRVHEHLKEREAVALVALANVASGLLVGRDDSRDRDPAGVGEQPSELAHTAHVLFAVGPAEGEIAADSASHLVAIEQVRRHASLNQALLDRR